MRYRSFLRSLAVAAALLVSLETGTRAGDSFVVLVHRGNVVTSLSRSELKRIVTGGTRQWESGAAVQLGIIPAPVPETSSLGTLVDLTVRDLLARLQEQVFNGEIRRPVVLRSSTDCVALARSNPGAICVASSTFSGSPDVQVVTIR